MNHKSYQLIREKWTIHQIVQLINRLMLLVNKLMLLLSRGNHANECQTMSWAIEWSATFVLFSAAANSCVTNNRSRGAFVSARTWFSVATAASVRLSYVVSHKVGIESGNVVKELWVKERLNFMYGRLPWKGRWVEKGSTEKSQIGTKCPRKDSTNGRTFQWKIKPYETKTHGIHGSVINW